jgi:hypothetical protein
MNQSTDAIPIDYGIIMMNECVTRQNESESVWPNEKNLYGCGVCSLFSRSSNNYAKNCCWVYVKII